MPLDVWEYERGDDALRASAIVATDGREPPDFHVEEVSSRGDHLTVQVVSGALGDPAAILRVEGRGTFEIVRVEPWPSRLLLVLRAWPSRGSPRGTPTG